MEELTKNNITEQWVKDTIAAAPDAYGHLRGKTENQVRIDNLHILFHELGIVKSMLRKMFAFKLVGYRIVENINELCRGRYIRWMVRRTLVQEWQKWIEYNESESESESDASDTSMNAMFYPTITAGGFLANITMGDSGTKITWRNRKFTTGCFMLDDCILFQALSHEEKLCLAVQSINHQPTSII